MRISVSKRTSLESLRYDFFFQFSTVVLSLKTNLTQLSAQLVLFSIWSLVLILRFPRLFVTYRHFHFICVFMDTLFISLINIIISPGASNSVPYKVADSNLTCIGFMQRSMKAVYFMPIVFLLRVIAMSVALLQTQLQPNSRLTVFNCASRHWIGNYL